MTSIVNIKGGLGNQLFQYAYGKYLNALMLSNDDLGTSGSVAYNVDWFKKNRQRSYMLPEIIKPDVPVTDKKATHDGYYQDVKYTDVVRWQLLQEVESSDSIDTIAMHVRRGDYVNHPKYVNLSLDYYNEAYAEMVKRHGTKNVFIFSDDPEYCKTNMVYPDSEVIDIPDIEAFNLFRRCSYKIIANSTFSWWAAYLGSGSVVSPSKWFHDPVKQERAINQIPSIWQII